MFDEQACLMSDPFAGDFGGAGGGDRILSDKIVKFRKPAACHLCAQSIEPGTRGRSRAEVYDGELMSFRWCAACCKCMAEDDDEGMMERERLREETLEPQP